MSCRCRHTVLLYLHVRSAARGSVDKVLKSGGPSPLSPYFSMLLPLPPSLRRRIADSWSQQHANTAASLRTSGVAPSHHTSESLPVPNEGSRPPRASLAYISRRFERYPGTQLMLALFGSHDRASVTVRCFASGPDDASAERQRVRRDCDEFVDVSSLGPRETATVVRCLSLRLAAVVLRYRRK